MPGVEWRDGAGPGRSSADARTLLWASVHSACGYLPHARHRFVIHAVIQRDDGPAAPSLWAGSWGHSPGHTADKQPPGFELSPGRLSPEPMPWPPNPASLGAPGLPSLQPPPFPRETSSNSSLTWGHSGAEPPPCMVGSQTLPRKGALGGLLRLAPS